MNKKPKKDNTKFLAGLYTSTATTIFVLWLIDLYAFLIGHWKIVHMPTEFFTGKVLFLLMILYPCMIYLFIIFIPNVIMRFIDLAKQQFDKLETKKQEEK